MATCYVCGAKGDDSYAARVIAPGPGLVEVCSAKCAADPKFDQPRRPGRKIVTRTGWMRSMEDEQRQEPAVGEETDPITGKPPGHPGSIVRGGQFVIRVPLDPNPRATEAGRLRELALDRRAEAERCRKIAAETVEEADRLDAMAADLAEADETGRPSVRRPRTK
jgi:hypothetical protein